ncbi:hypothetical protein WH47_02330, partial [Habropoda laboriosa]
SDTVPSYYYLFHVLQHFLVSKKFYNITFIRNTVERYFNEKSKKFYSGSIMSLPKRWEEIEKQEADYIFS